MAVDSFGNIAFTGKQNGTNIFVGKYDVSLNVIVWWISLISSAIPLDLILDFVFSVDESQLLLVTD